MSYTFQSTRPIRGATQEFGNESRKEDISIHAPHTGRDVTAALGAAAEPVFQSTRPIRGATWAARMCAATYTYFNPRAPYGARLIKCTLT